MGGRFVLAAAAIVLVLGVGEFAFRRALFSGAPAFARYRNPHLYASYDSDDYWKLEYLFGEKFSEPKVIDPVVGWRGDFDATFTHREEEKVGARRPVLLYGDSFSNYLPLKKLQDYFNEDPELSTGCYLLNYGMGGYGLDQIQLVFEKTITHFKKPIVLYSFLVDDLGRALLSFRVGQKPHVDLSGAEPRVVTPKFEPSTADFVRKNPVAIRSYLYRLLVFGGLLPSKVADWLQGAPVLRRNEQEIARFLLSQAVQTAHAQAFPIHFLLFSEVWRLQAADPHQAIAENAVKAEDHWFTKDLIAEDRARSGRKLGAYFVQDGHPSSAQYELIFAAIRRQLLPACKSRS